MTAIRQLKSYRKQNAYFEKAVADKATEMVIDFADHAALFYNEKLEEIILAAVLTDSSVMQTLRFLDSEHFFLEKHMLIFDACQALYKAKEPIDLITVAFQLRKTGHEEETGGAVYLSHLSMKIGSAANVEYHGRILQQLWLRRDALTKSHLFIQKLKDTSTDIFDLRNDLADDMRYLNLNSMLRVRSANERMLDGAKAPKLLQMAGSLWKKSEMCIMFAGPKRGKSILGVQIADAISRGEELLGGILPNECDPQKVGYYDFELNDAEYFERYSNAEHNEFQSYDFNDNLLMIDRNPKAVFGGSNAQKSIVEEIRQVCLTYSLECIVIDNITWLATQTNSDVQASMELMKDLVELKNELGISMLILAHTKKRTVGFKITENDMGGSIMLTNFASCTFAIEKSAVDPNIRYIKEIVRRSGTMHYDEDNIIECEITSENQFLKYKFLGFGTEQKHLENVNDEDVVENILLEAATLRVTTPDSWRDIYQQLDIQTSIGWTARHFTREAKKVLEKLEAAEQKKPFPKPKKPNDPIQEEFELA